MKKVLFFLPTVKSGGAERIFTTLLNHLDRDKYELTLLTIAEPRYEIGSENQLRSDVRVVKMGLELKKVYYPRILIETVRQLSRLKPDLILSTTIKANLIVSIANRLYPGKCKLVLREANNQSAALLGGGLKRWIPWMYNVASDWNIAVSDGVKQEMVSSFGILEERIKRIYNPVDIELVRHQAEISISQERKFQFKIVSVGRLAPQKDYPTFIRALERLKNMGYAFECSIIGTGKLHKEIDSLIQQAGLSETVKMLGYLDNPYAHMRSADLLVHHSRWEGCGNVILEALAVGMPVIASSCPHSPAEILQGGCGLLFEPGDDEELARLIQEVMESPDLREQLREKGIERAEYFSVKRAVSAYEAVFDAVLEDKE